MQYKVKNKQFNSHDCFICGIHNHSGLQAKFYELDNDVVCTKVRGDQFHQSYPNRMHGGIISALLDETVGRAISIFEPDTFGVTIKLEITYRKPVPLDEDILVCGWLTQNKGLSFKGDGVILSSDGKTVLATASGTFYKQQIESIIGHEPLPGWQLIKDQTPLESVEIDYEFTRNK